MRRTEAISCRVQPAIKWAALEAATDDHRSVSSLLEKLLVAHLRETGYLPADRRRAADGPHCATGKDGGKAPLRSV